MLKICCLIVVVVVTAVSASSSSIEANYAAFKRYTKRFNKDYEEGTPEFTRRFRNYVKTMTGLSKARNANPHATFGETFYTDFSETEFKTYHNADKAIATFLDDQKKSSKAAEKFVGTLKSLPSHVDWRTKGAVTPIKNQGQCGSCWAFSTTGNIEGQWFLAGHNLTSLSEQQLVSCCPLSLGCDGGFSMLAEFWLVDFMKGEIATEASYPYTSGNDVRGKCNETDTVTGATITGSQLLLPWDHKGMETFIAERGPLSVAVNAAGSAWQNYVNGVMTSCKANLPDHMVLVVGYGTSSAAEGSLDYWIVKNSWGTSWGESGYLRIERGKNLCNIELLPNSAIVPKK